MARLVEYQQEYNYRTIPMVFIDGKFIGGYRELYQMVEKKEIDLREFK